MPWQRSTARRARLVVLLIEFAFLIGVLLTGSATSALADTISGQVTRSSDGTGIQGTVVHVVDANSDGPDAATATTDVNGNYTATVPAGSYFVYTQDIQGYINKVYPNFSCSASCDLNSLVPLSVAGAATNVNFVLDLGGRISGTVTSTATGLPIAGIRVMFVNGAPGPGGTVFTVGVTDALGHYISDGGTIAGNVYAFTDNSLGYQNEVYDNVKCFNCDVESLGALIPVTGAGTTTTGIDFALDPGGNVSGTVTGTGGVPLANVQVNLEDAIGNQLAKAVTDALGNYTTAGVPSGSYYVSTRNRIGYADLIYNNLACYGGNCNPTNQGATALPLTAGSTTSNINFALQVGGVITGTVTTAGAVPVSGVFVGIFATAGAFLGGIDTNQDGIYRITVPPGSYNVAIIGDPGYTNQIYSGVPCPSTPFCATGGGTQVFVTAGLTTSNINFGLVAGVGGGITGTVTNAAAPNNPIPNIAVQVLTPSGISLGTSTTNASGVYSFSGLAPGSYYVRTIGNSNFMNQLYPGIVCVSCNVTTSGGTLIAVASGVTTANINFALALGGRISGTVTNAATAGALQGILVQFYSSTGVSVGQVNTAASGMYVSPALPSGSYFVRTAVTASQNFIDEVYNNKPCVPCAVMTGDAVTVVGTSTTSNINFALDGGGSISGTVTDTGGVPVPVMSLFVIDTNGIVVKTATTDASGNYSVGGLPGGTYIVRTNPNAAMQNFVTQVYSGIPFNGIPNVFTPVSVTVGNTHSGVNFSLSSGGSINGMVTGDGGAPLASVGVAAFSASTGRAVKVSATDAFGLYVITGLPAGTYYLTTGAPALQTPYYIDEIFDNLPCLGCIAGQFPVVTLSCAPACTPSVTSGTPVDLAEGAVRSGVNFSLTSGAGAITGTVRDAGGVGLTSVTVAIFNSSGALVKSAVTAANSGVYFVRGLTPGTYYARTIVSPATPYALDAAFGGTPCAPCDVKTASSPIVVSANTIAIADFLLAAGGSIRGIVTDATTSNPLALANVQLYTASGALVETTFTSSLGTFTFEGLPAGNYRARTAVTGSLTTYGDALFNGISCAISCAIASGNTIAVTNGATTSGINFALTAKPTIAPIANVVTQLNTPANLPVTVGSVAGAAGLILTGSSSNTAVVPNANLIFGGSGANRTLMIIPAFNQIGATTITVTATDSTGSTSQTFAFSVATTPLDGNGDGKSDILWHNAVSGSPVTWFMDGAAVIGGLNVGPIDTAWQIVGRGDFNGDGRADILWRHSSSGALFVWFMDGQSIVGSAGYGVPDLSWQIVGLADYNGDGKTDILWRHSSGIVLIWFVNGDSLLGSASPGTVDPAWQIAGSGDYNADGYADILWRHSSGAVVIWLMQNGAIIGGGDVSTVDPSYEIVATGDFNGDGRSDILWRHPSGQVIIWEMDGLQVIGGGTVDTVDTAWQIVGTGDYNGDGKSDLLWRHSDGTTLVWLMNGPTVIGGGLVAFVDPVWQIVNLR